MCGNVGIAGETLTAQDANVLKYLLHFDELRGDDSTGIGLVQEVGKDGEVMFVIKALGAPSNLYRSYPKAFSTDQTILVKDLNVAIGHNRKATQGAINVDNAHPFLFEHVMGAHNGTVLDWDLRDLQGYKDFPVDSQIIYNHLDKTNNLQEIWTAFGFGQWKGAAALVWYDKRTKHINFARNDQRPLYYAIRSVEHKREVKQRTLYWASEEWMLHVALMLAKVKECEISEVKINQHYSFDVRDKLLPMTMEPLKEATSYFRKSRNRFSWYDNYYEDNSFYKENKSLNLNTPTKKMGQVIALPDLRPHQKLGDGKCDELVFRIVEHGSTVHKDDIRYFVTGWGKKKDFNIRVYIPREVKNPQEAVSNILKHPGYWSCKSYGKTNHDIYDFVTNTKVIQKVALEKDTVQEVFACYNDTYITRAELDILIAEGCAFCNKSLNNPHKIRWFDAETPLCSDCMPDIDQRFKLH